MPKKNFSKEEYFGEIKKFLRRRCDQYRFSEIGDIKEGDKKISKRDVGGRYYKEFTLEYIGQLDQHNPTSDLSRKANNLSSRIMDSYSGKFFHTDGKEHTVVHTDSNVEFNTEGEVVEAEVKVKPHFIPDPE